MTILTPWNNRGAYIPFDRPVPAIVTDPLASSDAGLCFSYDWLPVILTCLKTLQRPETWVGTADDIGTACLMAQKLFASLTEPCGGSGAIPFACPFDLSVADFAGLISTLSGYTPSQLGVYTGGVGFQSQSCIRDSDGEVYRGLGVTFVLGTPILVTQVSVRYGHVNALLPPAGLVNGLYVARSGSLVGSETNASDAAPEGTELEYVVNFGSPTEIDAVGFGMNDHRSLDAIGLGSSELYVLEFQGYGTPPPGC
jgi:hypothetical protein